MSLKEIDSLFDSFNRADSGRHLKDFFERVKSMADDHGQLMAVTNRFHAWGNEEGYFDDYDPFGPERDDAFLVEDYLRIAIRLMRLFKGGDLDMPMTIEYEFHNGVPFPSTYGGSPGRLGKQSHVAYALDDSELPKLQQLLDTTYYPFKNGYVQLAVDFFETSSSLRIPPVIFLLLIISLEVLFNSSERLGTKRICQNVSRLLAKNAGEQERIYGDLRNLYEKRGALIHEGLYNYNTYLTTIRPHFDKASKEHPLADEDRRFIQPDDYRRLSNYVRESILAVLKFDLSKEDLLHHLSKPTTGT